MRQPECCYRCAREWENSHKNEAGHFPLTVTRMFVCPNCGNKRCPKSTDHRLPCTGSNETGQNGSRYA